MISQYAWLRHYIKCALKSQFKSVPDLGVDLLFVVPAGSRGWILDAICKELCQYYPGKSCVYYQQKNEQIPSAKAYFFIHYNMLFSALSKQPEVWNAKRFVWYTHNSDDECGAKKREIPWVLNRMSRVFTTNTKVHADLIRQGVKSKKLKTLLGAADPSMFTTHERKGKTVGISTAYYDRKNPDLMKSVIQLMPHIQFILVGKNWQKWERYNELLALPNLTFEEAGYDQYPSIYKRFDVYLSTSMLEGGPIPLVETMMCNVVPVVSDTGFCRDLIKENENGFIFPLTAKPKEVVALIEKALTHQGDISASVRHLSWRNMSHDLHSMVKAV